MLYWIMKMPLGPFAFTENICASMDEVVWFLWLSDNMRDD